MLFERDHVNPEIKHNLDEARVLRAKYLRQLFSRKRSEATATLSTASTAFIIMRFFRHSRDAFRNPAAAESQSS